MGAGGRGRPGRNGAFGGGRGGGCQLDVVAMWEESRQLWVVISGRRTPIRRVNWGRRRKRMLQLRPGRMWDVWTMRSAQGVGKGWWPGLPSLVVIRTRHSWRDLPRRATGCMAFLPVSIYGVADKSSEEREHALRESELLVIVRVDEQFWIVRWIDVAPGQQAGGKLYRESLFAC
ncbi:hypothetical protein GGX14DRAFT_397004 [Mycena pura]|uniref:Uncharacterized protein n=1 Tax=Mycena pura TaxID=153505 RepID=A0AAD6V9M2_9AGAR|nr:hypothetical protein GGX14DRAFT_397004 [Mycena pura]